MITMTHSQTNRIAGFGILLPPRSIAPSIRTISPRGGSAGAGGGQALAHDAVSSSRPSLGEAAEELRLRDDRLLELVDQHALVRRVDVREAVGRAEQQDLGVRHRLAGAR